MTKMEHLRVTTAQLRPTIWLVIASLTAIAILLIAMKITWAEAAVSGIASGLIAIAITILQPKNEESAKALLESQSVIAESMRTNAKLTNTLVGLSDRMESLLKKLPPLPEE